LSAAQDRQGSGSNSRINLCVIANASGRRTPDAAIFFSMSLLQAQKDLPAGTTVLMGKEFHSGFSLAQVESGASRPNKFRRDVFLPTLYVLCEWKSESLKKI
jgi:hypothetical protein